MLSRRAVLIGGASLLPGCAAAPLYPFVPEHAALTAQIPEMERVRLWGDGPSEALRGYLEAEVSLLKARYRAAGNRRPTADILAISGGADDGAFSAGVLVGWGERGDRPMFDAVTGISAGSLVAPFAFLGRSYDRGLAGVFTEHSAGEIYRANPLAGVLGGPALADNAPLAELIAGYVDRRMLRAIARERMQGRYLFIGTTNLHAQRPVFWDMGRIAAYDTPRLRCNCFATSCSPRRPCRGCFRRCRSRLRTAASRSPRCMSTVARHARCSCRRSGSVSGPSMRSLA